MTTATMPSKAELKTRLDEQEAKIVTAEQSYVEIGEALSIIRDDKLYEALDYSTFEEYGQKVWQYQRGHLYRLIDAAKVVKNLRIEHQQIPQKESHARLFNKFKVNDENQRTIWGHVLKKEPNLARHTAELIESVILTEIPSLKGSVTGKKAAEPASVKGTEQQVTKHSIPAVGGKLPTATPRFSMADLKTKTYAVNLSATVDDEAANELLADVGGSLTRNGNTVFLDFEGPLSDVFGTVERWVTAHDVSALSISLQSKEAK